MKETVGKEWPGWDAVPEIIVIINDRSLSDSWSIDWHGRSWSIPMEDQSDLDRSKVEAIIEQALYVHWVKGRDSFFLMVLQLSTFQIVCLVVSEYQSLQIVAMSAMKHYNAYSGMHGGRWSKISFPFFRNSYQLTTYRTCIQWDRSACHQCPFRIDR